jgi:type II secretory pathway component PulF
MLSFQPELPHSETDATQEYGVYTITEFFAENWFYFAVILILIIIYWLYLRRQKKIAKTKREKQNLN